MSPCPSGSDGCIETDHLGADHGKGFALGGIDLAGHDRTAGLIGGKPQFAETGPRPAAEQAHVIGDAQQSHRQQSELPHAVNQGIVPRHHRKQIVGRAERKTGLASEIVRHL